jgi:hypothetical protein
MTKQIIKKILVLVLLSPLVVAAVSIGESIGGNLLINITPENPGGFARVSMKVNSYDLDLKTSYLKWYLNNKLEKEGVGLTYFEFQTGAEGKNTTIKITAENAQKIIERSITINPASVDIIYQAKTYVPPSYRGKALSSPQSEVGVFAIPNFTTEKGTRINDKDLVYEWQHNGKRINTDQNRSRVQIIISSLLSQNTIRVKVFTKDGIMSAEKEINIKAEPSQILFYKDNPIEGTNYNESLLGYVRMDSKEISVRAEPYFFSLPSSSEPELDFYWRMNNKSIYPNEDSPKIITLRSEATTAIESVLSLTIKSVKRVFQEAQSYISLESGTNL